MSIKEITTNPFADLTDPLVLHVFSFVGKTAKELKPLIEVDKYFNSVGTSVLKNFKYTKNCTIKEKLFHISRFLVAKNTEIDFGIEGNLAIRMAAYAGCGLIVSRLLDRSSVNPSARNNEALTLACSQGHSSVVKHLLARVSIKENFKEVLFAAIEGGNLTVLQSVLNDKDADFKQYGLEGLLHAIRCGKPNMIKFFEEKKVEITSEVAFCALEVGNIVAFNNYKDQCGITNENINLSKLKEALIKAVKNGHFLELESTINQVLFNHKDHPALLHACIYADDRTAFIAAIYRINSLYQHDSQHHLNIYALSNLIKDNIDLEPIKITCHLLELLKSNIYIDKSRIKAEESFNSFIELLTKKSSEKFIFYNCFLNKDLDLISFTYKKLIENLKKLGYRTILSENLIFMDPEAAKLEKNKPTEEEYNNMLSQLNALHDYQRSKETSKFSLPLRKHLP